MHRTYLIIGGNTGDRERYLNQTVSCIESKIGRIVSKSDIFESEPWGFDHNLLFLNQVLEVETDLTALCLLDLCNYIENELGRERFDDIYTSRTVDIDILIFDDYIFTLPPLIIPHRHLHERMFVLEPLSQIAPDLLHPLLGLSIKELKKSCEDKGKVWKHKELVRHEP